MEQQPIVVRAIVEIMGAPKEFVHKALLDHVDKIKQDGLNVQFEKFAEPKAQDNYFTQFVELQIAFKDLEQLLDFCIDSMPSAVEIMSPDKLQLDTAVFEDFINDFQARLHHTDMMLKGLQAQKKVLDQNALNVFHNFIKFACRAQPHSIEQLSELLGIGVKELQPFVENMVNKGELKKEGKVYVTNG
ncbi:MAG: hypothetical protein QW165_02915 [Candidatus Woesearchaeota archaeon]